MGAAKVGTCCYCGLRAALVLRGNVRHELNCTGCGAPLSKLKMLPNAAVAVTAPAATPAHPAPSRSGKINRKAKTVNRKKYKKRKGLRTKVWSKIWDAVEDIFD